MTETTPETAPSRIAADPVDVSFDAFYAAQWGRLQGFALALTRSSAAADEVAQEAMVRTLARWGTLRDPLPWALRVVRNLAVDELRRTNRETPTERMPEAASPPVQDGHVLDVVLALPERLRDVVLLHYLLDQSVADVARILRRPSGTIKRRLSDARTALAATLGDLR